MGYHQTNRKTDTGKTLKRWPVFVDHFTITFTRSGSDGPKKVSVTGLLKTGELDFENDQVELEADQRLWELYQTDYTVLLHYKPINALTRKEAAQALYTFIASLPTNPAPISFKRIRDRLSLLSPVKEQTVL